MDKMKKNTFKVMVLIALFCTAAFADGEMGGGGLADTGTGVKSDKTVVTGTGEGEMGGGGLAGEGTYLEYLLDSIYDYFDRIS